MPQQHRGLGSLKGKVQGAWPVPCPLSPSPFILQLDKKDGVCLPRLLNA